MGKGEAAPTVAYDSDHTGSRAEKREKRKDEVSTDYTKGKRGKGQKGKWAKGKREAAPSMGTFFELKCPVPTSCTQADLPSGAF
jgi:hypothetical protein